MSDNQINKLYVALEHFLSLHEAQAVAIMIYEDDRSEEEIIDYLEKIKAS
jgi:hypothetical protein